MSGGRPSRAAREAGGTRRAAPAVRHQIIALGGERRTIRQIAERCQSLGVRHKRIRPYTPKTNGKAERFIQTLLREWAAARQS